MVAADGRDSVLELLLRVWHGTAGDEDAGAVCRKLVSYATADAFGASRDEGDSVFQSHAGTCNV